jgi:transposase
MRKHSSKKATRKAAQPQWSVGLDLGDRTSRYAIVDREGQLIEEGECVNTPAGLAKIFADMPRARIALETGGQSGWIARELTKLGHETLVANARELRGIWGSVRKNDRRDAEKLARYARLDPALLHPTRVRSPEAQLALSELRVRDALVRARTLFVNAARGLAKAHGQRLAKTSTKSFAVRAAADLKPELASVLEPLFSQVAALSERIVAADRAAQQTAEQDPAAARLMQVPGVGPLTALTFVHTLEDPSRFRHSREVGAYLGLTPRQAQSGDRDPQLPISKAGDVRLRRLLVQCAHRILGPFGHDSSLRRWAQQLASRGGAAGRKRAVTALARKLAVVLHRLWIREERWRPFPAEV